jgi:hypothetical protein
LLTNKHFAEFTIPDEVIAWTGAGGTAKIITYEDQYAKLYYYFTNDYFAIEMDFVKNGSIWQLNTWKAVWSSGSADDFIWPYIHHSPIGLFLIIILGALLLLTAVAVLCSAKKKNYDAQDKR